MYVFGEGEYSLRHVKLLTTQCYCHIIYIHAFYTRIYIFPVISCTPSHIYLYIFVNIYKYVYIYLYLFDIFLNIIKRVCRHVCEHNSTDLQTQITNVYMIKWFCRHVCEHHSTICRHVCDLRSTLTGNIVFSNPRVLREPASYDRDGGRRPKKTKNTALAELHCITRDGQNVVASFFTSTFCAWQHYLKFRIRTNTIQANGQPFRAG